MNEKIKELAIGLIEFVEDLLEENDITIPSEDREGDPSEARLYGSPYYDLEDKFIEFLKESNLNKLSVIEPFLPKECKKVLEIMSRNGGKYFYTLPNKHSVMVESNLSNFMLVDDRGHYMGEEIDLMESNLSKKNLSEFFKEEAITDLKAIITLRSFLNEFGFKEITYEILKHLF